MDTLQTKTRNYEAIAWGALFIWWGFTELGRSLPDGTAVTGVGLILLGINGTRALNGIPTSRFSTTFGILALALGVLQLAGSVLNLPFELPVFAILLIIYGMILLARELIKT